MNYKIEPDIRLIYEIPPTERNDKEKLLLERHFNDLYVVFLHKLTEFALSSSVSQEDASKLRKFFEELLKARILLGR